MSLFRKQTKIFVGIYSNRRRKSCFLLACIIICASVLLWFYYSFYLHATKSKHPETITTNSTTTQMQISETDKVINSTLSNDINIKTNELEKESEEYSKNHTAQSNLDNNLGADITKLPNKNISQEKIESANNLLDFYNQSVATLSTEWYSIPEIIEKNLAIYTETWQLPKLDARLLERTSVRPSFLSGMNLPCFKDRNLEKYVNEMDTAIHSMLADYRALEKYNNDEEIKDDWRKGKNYVKSIEKSQKKFLAARSTWNEIVRPEVTAAENLLLQNHPLQKHSMLAKQIFDLFAKTVEALGQDKIDRKSIQIINKQLDKCLNESNSLSFSAGPEYERHYRTFLAAAKSFANLLHDGLASGFYRPLREKLNQQIRASRDAYNNFAAKTNISHI